MFNLLFHYFHSVLGIRWLQFIRFCKRAIDYWNPRVIHYEPKCLRSSKTISTGYVVQLVPGRVISQTWKPVLAACPASEWVGEEKGSLAVLSLTRHRCSIRCESSHVAHGASKQRWASRITHHDIPKGVQKLV